MRGLAVKGRRPRRSKPGPGACHEITALFIAGLAFPDPNALASAKLGILGGSLLAGALAVLMGRIVLSPTPAVGAATTVEEAEQATER